MIFRNLCCSVYYGGILGKKFKVRINHNGHQVDFIEDTFEKTVLR